MNIQLRAAEPEDLDMMYELENDQRLWHLSATTVPYSHHALQQFIENNTLDIYADRQVRLTVEADGHAAGCADLFNIDAKNLHAEVAIGLTEKNRSKGIGSEALRLLTNYAGRHLGLHHLIAIVPTTNTASQRAFEAAGFQSAGTLTAWIRNGRKFDDATIYQINCP